jgi:hypothetical protein
MNKAQTIQQVCMLLLEDRIEQAALVAKADYPFLKSARASRKYTPYQSTLIFMRDGFIDRYSGEFLVFPGVLRLLSILLPEEFPAHPNWKMDESHIVFWELFPTIDHIEPIARGGQDDETNWVTTSMLRNSAKSNWTLQELGWELFPAGQLVQWDGLTGWFLEYLKNNSTHLQHHYIKLWRQAALRAFNFYSP